MRATMLVAGFAALLALAAAVACSPFGSDPAPAPVDPDAAAGDAAPPDPEPPPPPDDGGSTLTPIGLGDAGVDAACPVFPTAARDATPGAATGKVCNVQGVLDGGAAGLDYTSGGTVVQVGLVSVTSCVGVEFAVPLRDLTLRLASTGKACDTACTPVTGCGTYDFAHVFVAPHANAPSTNWIYAGHASLSPSFQEFPILVDPATLAQGVIVCRGGGGGARDDVLVDAIRGHCR
jgi:hypothetical protein